MFVARLSKRWLACNPHMDTDQHTQGAFDLKYNSCDSVEMTYTPHTFSVIKEGNASLAIYLNNYRTDKEPLWEAYPQSFNSTTLRRTVLPDFVESPTEGTLRECIIVLTGCRSQPSVTFTERGDHPPGIVTTLVSDGDLENRVLHNGPPDLHVGNAVGDNADRPAVPGTGPVAPPASPRIVELLGGR